MTDHPTKSLATISARRSRLVGALDVTSPDAGVHSLDLVGRELAADDLRVLVSAMRIAIGGWTKADEAKTAVLFQHVLDKGWSKEYLDAVLYRFLEKKLYGGKWSLGDFFECAVPADLHPYAWVKQEVLEKGRSMREMEGYRVPVDDRSSTDINDRTKTITLWRYKGGPKLPFAQVAFAETTI